MVYTEGGFVKARSKCGGNRDILWADFAFSYLCSEPHTVGGFAFSYFEPFVHGMQSTLSLENEGKPAMIPHFRFFQTPLSAKYEQSSVSPYSFAKLPGNLPL